MRADELKPWGAACRPRNGVEVPECRETREVALLLTERAASRLTLPTTHYFGQPVCGSAGVSRSAFW